MGIGAGGEEMLELLPSLGLLLILGLLPSFGVPQCQSGGAPCWARLPEAFFLFF